MIRLYDAELTASNPGLIVFLIHQSEPFPSNNRLQNIGRQLDDAFTMTNLTINQLANAIPHGRDYLQIAVIRYDEIVDTAWKGKLAERSIWTISDIVKHPQRREQRTKLIYDGVGGLLQTQIELPIWIEAIYNQRAPMNEAMSYTLDLVSEWISGHPESFPPVIVHITDAQPTDGDPRKLAEALRSLQTVNGRVIQLNCFLDRYSNESAIFLDQADILSNDFAKLFFEMSSPLPKAWLERITTLTSIQPSRAARAFIYNSSTTLLASILKFQEDEKDQNTRHYEAGKYLFLSHATRDDQLTDQIADLLREAGYRTFVDHRDIKVGMMDWDTEVETALDTCDAMVLVATQSSMASQNVKVEWNYYLEEEKPIVLVMGDDCRRPFRLRLLQYVDFHTLGFSEASAKLLAGLEVMFH